MNSFQKSFEEEQIFNCLMEDLHDPVDRVLKSGASEIALILIVWFWFYFDSDISRSYIRSTVSGEK